MKELFIISNVLITLILIFNFAKPILFDATLLFSLGWWLILFLVAMWIFIFVMMVKDIKVDYSKKNKEQRRLLKRRINKKELNNFENRDIYNKVKKHYDNTFKKYQDELRRQAILKWTTVIIVAIVSLAMMILPIKLGAGLGTTAWLMIFGCLGIGLNYLIIKVPIYEKKKYSEKYKTDIIKNILECINPNWKYDFENRELVSGYYDSNFDRGEYDKKIEVDDYICCKMDNGLEIKMCDLDIKRRVVIERDVEYEFPLFNGLFVDVTLDRFVKEPIKMYSSLVKTDDHDEMYDMTAIKTDVQEFNELFVTYATEQMETFQILTSDVIDAILSFYKETSLYFDISIKRNHIYIKLHTGKMFEPKFWTDALNVYDIGMYNSVVKFVIRLTTELNKTLKPV